MTIAEGRRKSIFRFSPELDRKIAAAAAKSLRSKNAEVMLRLMRSFERDDAADAEHPAAA
jgi:hypothetical protein